MQEVRKAIIGHFKSADSGAMLVYRKVAISLRDDCSFHAAVDKCVHCVTLSVIMIMYCVITGREMMMMIG